MELDVFRALFDEHTFDQFDAEQSHGVLELLIAATFVDSEVTNRERLALMQAIDAMPNLPEKPWLTLDGDEGARFLSRVGVKYLNPEERDDFLDGIIARFDEAQTEIAFDAVVAILHCDGLGGAEFEFCLDVGRRMGLDIETIREIVSRAWAIS